MLPFTVELSHGEPVYEQLLTAVRRALFTGQLRDGDPFPSVRALSQELRISPTTAHKVVSQLKSGGYLAPRPGIGMVVTSAHLPDAHARFALIAETARKLVREAKSLSLSETELIRQLQTIWAGENGH